MWKCSVCGREKTVLFRINPVGQPGVFACREHVGDAKIDPLVEEVANHADQTPER